MTGINALSSYTPQTVKLGTQKEATPAATAAVTAYETMKPAASAQCSFSDQSLHELSHALHEAYEGAGDMVSGVASAIGDSVDALEKGAVKVGDAVYSLANTGLNEAESAASYVGDKVSNFAHGAWDVASKTATDVADAAEATGNYVGNALVAGAQALNKLV